MNTGNNCKDANIISAYNMFFLAPSCLNINTEILYSSALKN